MEDFLRSIGATNIRDKPGGKHLRLVFEYDGVERFHTITDSDAIFGPKKAVADLKRMLGLQANGKRIGERRCRRRRCPAAPAECPVITPLHDWRDDLPQLAREPA